jgi:YHS domain-containing protein
MVGLLLYIAYRIIISLTSAKKTSTGSSDNSKPATETHRDPVCGLYISEEDAVVGKLHGQRHYFCSMNCLEKFREKLDHTSA